MTEMLLYPLCVSRLMPRKGIIDLFIRLKRAQLSVKCLRLINELRVVTVKYVRSLVIPDISLALSLLVRPRLHLAKTEHLLL